VNSSGVRLRTLVGYLAGIVVGTTSITLLFLGMRAVMDIGGACADGGPYVTAQPCPSGTPLAMLGGMFGLFGAAGLIMWFGSQISTAAAAVVALGWPALFLSLGWNFINYGLRPPDGEPGPVWGWLIPGILFWVMGAAPVVVAIAAWREARAGRPGNRVSSPVINRLSWQRASSGSSRSGPSASGLPTDPSARRVDDTTFVSNAFAPSWSAAASSAPEPVPGDSSDLVDDLEALARLHERGDLNDDEYARAKADRLADAEAAG
jgi:hypothetical protein